MSSMYQMGEHQGAYLEVVNSSIMTWQLGVGDTILIQSLFSIILKVSIVFDISIIRDESTYP